MLKQSVVQQPERVMLKQSVVHILTHCAGSLYIPVTLDKLVGEAVRRISRKILRGVLVFTKIPGWAWGGLGGGGL